jgi:hypothetical protein
VGSFVAGKITFTAPAGGDVLYTVEVDATKPMSGGATICSSASQNTNMNSGGTPLKVSASATATAMQLSFSGCS